MNVVRTLWNLLNEDDPQSFGAGLFGLVVLGYAAVSTAVMVGLFVWAATS